MTQLILIPYAMLVLTIGICIYLFLTLKRDLRVMESRSLRHAEQLRGRLQELAGELETVRKALDVMEQRSDPGATVTRTLGPGVRIQALRMIRNGEGSEHISAVLGLPRTDVDLLVKVQKLLADPALQSTS